MSASASMMIDLVEAAYDLEIGPENWLPNVVARGTPVFDLGLGFYAASMGGLSPQGEPLVTHIQPSLGSEELPLRFFQVAQECGADLVMEWTGELVAKEVTAVSELKDRWPRVFDMFTRHLECKDGLAIAAIDPDNHGLTINIPAPELIKLSSRARDHWRMLTIHLGAGHRLRRTLSGAAGSPGVAVTHIVDQAEALIDPRHFSVSEAVAGAKSRSALETLRNAAVRVDKARGKLRKSNPEQALEIWHGLVRGRWSLVDWFDTDGRRFVLAKPNAPDLGDPRGLSERELQVAAYAARGESSKLIGYRFGISRPRVSTLLGSAMRKLGVKTQAQLVERMRGLPDTPRETP